ncbi:unnamed protein product, partial [Mesorhabditis belari]|uniref:Uncharacterized protein n=1 Tax=Mesorhabditis belari TaxID=2138241 RepID=A0AAF3J678_9BILA
MPDESDDDEINIEMFDSYLGIHAHCSHCIFAQCSYTECPMDLCKYCHIPLHCCKVEDHTEICLKVQVPCLNSRFGCNEILRRDRISAHLPSCPASAIVCTRETNWKCLNDEAKMQLKRWGKGIESYERVSIPEEELDVLLAQNAQEEIIQSYSYSRKSRVRCRDRINNKHPIVPLRSLFTDRGEQIGPLDKENHDQGDSSDEERAIEKAKRKKQLAMFANCWMCQYDPASQHLHTLGNENQKFRHQTKKRNTPKEIGTFNSTRKLMLAIDEEFIPEVTTKADNIYYLRRGGTVYTKVCLGVIRRDHVSNHFRSQHAEGENQIPCMIQRCPLWHRGCSFYVTPLKPRNGRIRYFDGCFHFCPNTEESPLAERTLDTVPPVIFFQITKFLSTANLRVLSMVNKSMRTMLFQRFRWLGVVELLWKKIDGFWEENGFKWSFPKTDQPANFSYNSCPEMNLHIPKCPYSDPIEWSEAKVPVFPAEFLSPIFGSVDEARADLFVLPDVWRGDAPRLEDSKGRLRNEWM